MTHACVQGTGEGRGCPWGAGLSAAGEGLVQWGAGLSVGVCQGAGLAQRRGGAVWAAGWRKKGQSRSRASRADTRGTPTSEVRLLTEGGLQAGAGLAAGGESPSGVPQHVAACCHPGSHPGQVSAEPPPPRAAQPPPPSDYSQLLQESQVLESPRLQLREVVHAQVPEGTEGRDPELSVSPAAPPSSQHPPHPPWDRSGQAFSRALSPRPSSGVSGPALIRTEELNTPQSGG